MRRLAAGSLAAAVAAGAVALAQTSEIRGPLWLPLPERVRPARTPAQPAVPHDLAAAVAQAARSWGLGTADELRVHASLSGSPPAAIYNLHPAEPIAPAGDPRGAARGFVAAFAPVYGLTPADVAGVAEEERPGLAGGREVVLSQTVAGRRLYAARLRLHFAADGAFLAAVGTLYGGLQTDGEALLSESEAGAIARMFAAKVTGVEDADEKEDIGAVEAVFYPLHGSARPAWVAAAVAAPNGVDRFEVVVDAIDGRVLEAVPLTWYGGPQGQVFTSASPQPSLTPGVVPPVPDPPPYAARVEVPFAGDPGMDPAGWVAGTALAGNNASVRKYPTWRGGDFYSWSGTTITATDADFQFPLQLGPGQPDVRDYADAAGTNLFYLVNVAHDYFYSLGFDEAHGNFQADNFGRGGARYDQLYAYTQLGAGWTGSTPYASNNAWMSTPADGSSPLMGMYVWGPYPGGYYTDSSLDAEVVLHEFSHGVTGRLGTGFWGAQGGAINEGNSDLFALNFLTPPEAPVDGSFPAAAYTGQAFAGGIRTHPYSTQLAVNPLGYGSFGQVTEDGPEVHRDGEIWAVAMWEARAALIGRHGYAEGRARTAQLLVDALQLAPDLPSMIAMRDALLAAERNRYGGADQDVLWQAFAKRGMGFTAAGGNALLVHVLPDGGIPTPAAQLRLWESSLYLGETVRLLVGDGNAVAAAPVSLVTSNGDSETVSPAQDGAVYAATVVSRGGVPTPGNGTLEVAPGATLTASTTDSNPGAGTPVLSDTASIRAPYAIGQVGNLFDSGLATAVLGQGDDTRWSHPLPFPFPFFGKEHDVVWVSSNGMLTFGGGVAGAYAAVDDPGNLPFVAPFATDLVTNGSVQPDEGVYFYDGVDRFTVLWRGHEYGQPNPVNVAVSLFPDGSIRFDYGPGNELRGSSSAGPHHATVGVGRGSDTFAQAVAGYDGALRLGDARSIVLRTVAPGQPEISVRQGEDELWDGQAAPVFFGGAPVGGAPPTLTFTVLNAGYAMLSLGSITAPPGYTVTDGLPASLAPGASDTFAVSMDTAVPGTKSGEVSFATGDPDESPFSFPVTGSVSYFTWAPVASGTTARLVDVDAVSPTEAWAAGQRGLLHTTDGGATWPVSNAGTWHYGLRFSDPATGALVGSCGFSRTADGGATWSGFWWTECHGFTYTDVFPVSPNVVWLTSTASTVERWTRCPGCGFAGSDWDHDTFFTPGSGGLSAVHFPDLENGWFAGGGGTILRVADPDSSSPTFTAQPTGTSAYLYDLQMLDASTGWAVGANGTILHTDNGGAAWVPQDSHTSTNLLSVDFLDARHGLAAGEHGLVLATSDGGATWLPESTGTDATLFGVALPTAEGGFAVGDNGTILRRATAATLPDIAVADGAAAIADGQSAPVGFGDVLQNAAAPARTFTVRNQGGVTLTLGAVSVPAGFTVTEPLAASLAPGASDTFTVQMGTATAAARIGELSFSTNDPNESPFDFPIAGTVVPPGSLLPCAGDVPKPLPDSGTVTSSATVGGATTGITDVNVTLTIAHPYGRSLDVVLIAPTGARVELFTGVGGRSAFTATILDDEAATAIAAASPPFTGAFRPESALAVLDGASPNGTWTLEVTDRGADGYAGTLTGWCLTVTTDSVARPEITVLDGAAPIADGQAAAVSFGSAPQGGAAPARSFTVRNDGVAALSLGAVSVPSGFTLSEGLAPSLAPGAADTFTVTMATAAAGPKSGEIAFSTNDTDENPFNFPVGGEVVPVPEITVLDGATPIADGQATPVAFADAVQGEAGSLKIFTVRNDGAAALTLGAVSVPAGFTVTDGLAPSLAPAASDTFTVRLDTTTAGTRSGEVAIVNNDGDENPFNFAITGTVIGTPEVTVLYGGAAITDGQAAPIGFGSVTQGGAPVDRTFTVRNDGGAELTLGAVSVPAGFTLVEGLSATLAPAASDTFTVRLATATVGTKSGEVAFASNDGNENPFGFPIAGTVLPAGTLLPCSTDVPRPIADNSTVTSTLSITGAGTAITDVNVTLTIAHTWDSDLDVFLISAGGTRVELFTDVGGAGDDFTDTVLDDEAARSITSGSAPFTGSFRPEGSLAALDGASPNGTWTLEVTDDTTGDHGTILGWCLTVTTAEPEIVVLDGVLDVADGRTEGIDIGSAGAGATGPTRTFTVRNSGDATLLLGTPTMPAGFSLTEPLADTLAPGASDTFTVRLDTRITGTRRGEVSFSTNDADENPFNFAITGTVRGRPRQHL